MSWNGATETLVFGRKRQQFQITVDQCLSATPVRNPQAQERDLADGRLELALPCLKPWPIRIFSRRDRKTFLRRFELDPLGADIWRQMDGTRTVGTLIEYLVRTCSLAPQQGQQSMISFLQMLMTRGLVGLVVAERK
jgi:hypothetical protein